MCVCVLVLRVLGKHYIPSLRLPSCTVIAPPNGVILETKPLIRGPLWDIKPKL